MPRRVVYVSYDGLAEALGRSQVLPYVEGLAAAGHEFDLVTFEKRGNSTRFRERLSPGIRWTALRYHKTPTVPATALDMVQGLGVVALQALIARADLVHARSYVPATLALPFVKASRTPLIFDTRGLWPDEKVEAGSWSRDAKVYRGAKAVERVLFREADAITVLTNAFRDYLRREYPHRAEIHAPIDVIPTCVDLRAFRADVIADASVTRELEGANALVYAGSIGGFYSPKMLASFYRAWREVAAPARFLLITRNTPDGVREELRALGIERELVHRVAAREEMPSLLRCARAAVVLDGRRSGGLGTAPTKLGEALACGLPVAATPVGDVARVLDASGAGVLIEDMTDASFAKAARVLWSAAQDANAAARTQRLAEKWFSLERGVRAYDELYGRLPMKRSRAPRAPSDGAWPPAP